MQTEPLTQRSYLQRYRSIFSFCLAIVMLFAVGCSSGQPAPPPVYSPEQVDLIQQYTSDLKVLRSRIDELPELVASQEWADVENLIHGPLGELRFTMLNLARNLPAELESEARSLSKEVFKTLVKIDASAQAQSKPKAIEGYDELVQTYEEFLEVIPSDEVTS